MVLYSSSNMRKMLFSVLLVSLLIMSPIAVATASELGFQNHKVKSFDADSAEKQSKKDHKDNVIKVNDRDDDDDDDGDDDENDGTPALGTVYNVNATGDAARKAKGDGQGDKKDDDDSKGKDKDKNKGKDNGKTSEVKSASLSLKSEVQESSEGRIRLKILSGTLKIGDTMYNIERGNGKINKKNDNIEFKAKAFSGGDDFELVLKGNHGASIPENTGDTSTSVEFTSPQSKLASKWFLHLSGKIAIGGTTPSPPLPPAAVNKTTLAIAKSVNASTVLGKANLRYLITFANTGNFTATKINVTDTLPKPVSFVSSNGSIVSMSGSTIKFAAGNLSKGASKSIIIVVNVNGTTPNGTALKNNASVVWKNVDDSIGGQVNAMTTTTILAPLLQIGKRANATLVNPGATLLYTIRVNNTGGANARVNLTDAVPANTTLLATSLTPNSTSGRTLIWLISLASGGKLAINMTVKVNSSIGSQTITNTAVANYQNDRGAIFPAVMAQASAGITAVALMSLQKTVNATTAIGGAGLKYTLIFANSGNGTARRVNITDTLPSYVTFVSANGTVMSMAGKTIKFTVGNVSSSAGGRIVIVVKVNGIAPDQTMLRNNATLEWKNHNGSMGSTNASASTTVNAPVLTIIKNVNATAAKVGNHLFYNITIVNSGHADAMISLNDSLPSGVALTSTSLAPNIISGNSLVWNTLMLAPGGKATITILVQVNIGTLGTITNKATVTYKNTNDIEFLQISDQKSTLITAP